MDQKTRWKSESIKEEIWYPLTAAIYYPHDLMKVPKIPYSDQTRPPDSRFAPFELLPRTKLHYRTGWRFPDAFVTLVLSIMELYSVSCSQLMASILSALHQHVDIITRAKQ
mmetsp:Transcript_21882/g.32463  ORF Transcript_21882/g.32463 Transcript_21882/m.32463 type:complete len:111 (-) Transcript_21882:245-577(-)